MRRFSYRSVPPSRPARRHRGSDRGATVLEFAVVFPVFMGVVIGLFTGASLMNQQIQVSHAARDGARYGASLNLQAGWAAAVKDKVATQAAGSFDSADVCVALVKGPGDIPSVVTAGTPLDPTTRVVVRINAQGSFSWVVGSSHRSWKATSTALWEPFEQYAGPAGVPVAAGLTAGDFSSPSVAAPGDATCRGAGDTNQYAYVPSGVSTTTTTPPTTIPVTPPATVLPAPALIAAVNSQIGVDATTNCNLNGLHQGMGPVSTCHAIDHVASLRLNGAAPSAGVRLKVGDVLTISVIVPARGGHDAMYQETVDGIRNRYYDERSLERIVLPSETGVYLSTPTTVTMSRTDNGDRSGAAFTACVGQGGQDPARNDPATAVTVGPAAKVGTTGMWAQSSGGVLSAVWDDLSADRCVNALWNNGVYAGFTMEFSQTVTAVPVGVVLAPQWRVEPFRMARDDGSRTIDWGTSATLGWAAP